MLLKTHEQGSQKNAMATNNPRRAIIPLPQILEPVDTICWCIEIPDDEEHIAAFWGALSALGKQYSWGKPLTADSQIVAQYWLRLLRENIERFEDAF